MEASTDRLSLTQEEFVGFASCLAQLAHVQAVFQAPSGPVSLTREEFLRALLSSDPTLAALAGRWWDAAHALRAYVNDNIDGTVEAQPFRLGISGHVF